MSREDVAGILCNDLDEDLLKDHELMVFFIGF